MRIQSYTYVLAIVWIACVHYQDIMKYISKYYDLLFYPSDITYIDYIC